jgi:hypothetical protein
MIPLVGEHLELSNLWEQARADIREYTDVRDEMEAQLRVVLGEATYGALPDGTFLTLRTTKRADGGTHRTLRRARKI